MATKPLPYVTPAQYLEYDRKSETPNEYLYGEIFPIESASPWHSLISGNVLSGLKTRLFNSPCRVFNTGLRVSLDPKKGYVYPDVTVVCGQLQYLDAEEDTILNAKIAVEILSPSTRDYDLGGKARLYWNVPTLTDLIFIEQSKVGVEYWTRRPDGKWDRTLLESIGESLKIESSNCEIPLTEIYAGVELPPADE
jgi:Uma2 family endonuclease